MITTEQQKQLRTLNNEYREHQEALNHTQASLTRVMRIAEQNYHRKRKQILANGQDESDAP